MEIAKLVLQYIETLIWPIIALFSIHLFREPIVNILNRVKKADLPGGISIEAFPEKIERAKALSVEVKQEILSKKEHKEHPTIPITEANARMLNLGLAPSPTGLELSKYRALADQDPVLALAGLRIEVETMLKNLAKGFKVSIKENMGAGSIVRKLHQGGAITSRQADLISEILALANSAVHGQKVSANQAKEILDIAEVLRDDYVRWLSWGFPKKL